MNPKAAYEEMKEIEETGTSDVFPELKDPAIVHDKKRQAITEANNREQDAEKTVTDLIIEGKVKNRADIEAAGKGNLSASSIASLEKMLVKDPEYSAKNITQIKGMIDNYDAATDDKEGMPKYRAILDRIHTEVPKDMAGNLINDLYSISQKVLEGKARIPSRRSRAS